MTTMGPMHRSSRARPNERVPQVLVSLGAVVAAAVLVTVVVLVFVSGPPSTALVLLGCGAAALLGLLVAALSLLNAQPSGTEQTPVDRSALLRSRRVLQAIGTHAPVSWWTMDSDGHFTAAGGAETDDFAKVKIRDWESGSTKFSELITEFPAATKAIEQAMTGVPAKYRLEFGDRVMQEAYVPRLKDGEVVEIVGVSTDVTAEVALAAELQHQAEHDSLTGLLNRTGFERYVDDRIARSPDDAALIVIDISGMRDLNDLRSHQVGDHALTVIARRIVELSGPNAGCARIGGDEFCVFVQGLDQQSVDDLAADLLSSITDPISATDGELRLSAYTAVDGPKLSGSTFREVLPALDISLTEARRSGRNSSVRFCPTMIADFTERASLLREIEQAIRNRDFTVAYQPIWSLTSGKLAGAEALARWHHPVRGAISPAEFIPVAASAGLVTAIDQLVTEQAMCDLGAWRRAHPEMSDVRITVNLSSENLADDGLIDRIGALREMQGLAPRDLCLEITETTAVESFDLAQGNVQRLRSLGHRISLDDFGTGYSSISQLHNLAFDILKIDRSFVSGEVTQKQHELCELIVGLARALNLLVIAEGIETQEQLERMRSLGCNYAQGFLLARPLPADEFVDLVVAMHGTAPAELLIDDQQAI